MSASASLISDSKRLAEGRYIAVAVCALQVYEWLLMLDHEYLMIYQARWTSVKVAYLFCRYYPLILWPLYIRVWVGNVSLQTCEKIIHPLYCFVIPFQISAQAVIFIRAYAFTGRQRSVLILFSTSYLFLLGLNVWVFMANIHVQSNATYGTIGGSCVRDLTSTKFSLATRTGLLLVAEFFMDFLALFVIMVHCYRIRSFQGSLGRYFLKQGVVAFASMSAMNLFAATYYFIPKTDYRGIGLSLVLTFHNIMACRLILLLRRTVSPTETIELQEQSRIVHEAHLTSMEFLDQMTFANPPRSRIMSNWEVETEEYQYSWANA